MVKKIVIVSLAVVAGLFLLSKTHMGSYVHTAWNKVASSVQGAVPLEYEIERIRNEIAQLDPDMQSQISMIAKEVVAVENLQKDVADLRVMVNNKRDALVSLKKEVASGTRTVSIKGKDYTADKAREKLQRDFDDYKRFESTLQSKESLLTAKEQALDATRDQLAGMRQMKEELTTAVAQLEAELKTLQAAQTKSSIQLDDSRLARIKESVKNLKDSLHVKKVETDMIGQWREGRDVSTAKKQAQSPELLKQIDEHLGTTDADVVDKK